MVENNPCYPPGDWFQVPHVSNGRKTRRLFRVYFGDEIPPIH